jgi:hypothetical protein
VYGFQRAGEAAGRRAKLYRQARAMGLEGIVSKRRDCPYRSRQSEDWPEGQERASAGICDRPLRLTLVKAWFFNSERAT